MPKFHALPPFKEIFPVPDHAVDMSSRSDQSE